MPRERNRELSNGRKDWPPRASFGLFQVHLNQVEHAR